jgi:hypothetical protein
MCTVNNPWMSLKSRTVLQSESFYDYFLGRLPNTADFPARDKLEIEFLLTQNVIVEVLNCLYIKMYILYSI